MAAKLFWTHFCTHQVFVDSFSARHRKSVATPDLQYSDITYTLPSSLSVQFQNVFIVYQHISRYLKEEHSQSFLRCPRRANLNIIMLSLLQVDPGLKHGSIKDVFFFYLQIPSYNFIEQSPNRNPKLIMFFKKLFKSENGQIFLDLDKGNISIC